MFINLHIYDWSCFITAEGNKCHKDHIACNTEVTYYLLFYKEKKVKPDLGRCTWMEIFFNSSVIKISPSQIYKTIEIHSDTKLFLFNQIIFKFYIKELYKTGHRKMKK